MNNEPQEQVSDSKPAQPRRTRNYYSGRWFTELTVEDTAARADFNLSSRAASLIANFKDLVEESATEELMLRNDEFTQFDVDRLAEMLLWRFMEFATRGVIDRKRDEPEGFYSDMTKVHQFTLKHAADDFDLDFEAVGDAVIFSERK